MNIKTYSCFKDQQLARGFFDNWTHKISLQSNTVYHRIDIKTALGNTTVWAINDLDTSLKPIVIFPGYRTSGLIWDIDNNLVPLKKKFRIYLVDTNGQPVLSDGATPNIRSDGYGEWAKQLLDALDLQQPIVAGASFGGLICLKLCLLYPGRVEKVILLNPAGLQSFSLSPKNLYYNLLPIWFPTRRNIERFLRKAIFFKNRHSLSNSGMKLLVDYEQFALTQFIDRTQKPYVLSRHDLGAIMAPVYLLVGDKDILFPYRRTVMNARRFIPTLCDVYVLPDTGHGIETSRKAMNLVGQIAGRRSERIPDSNNPSEL